MPLPLSDDGDRLAPGRHLATLDEVEKVFVQQFPSSESRPVLFESFKLVRRAIQRVVPIKEQWVKGSFVTDKLEPGDIDVVTILRAEDVDGLDDVDTTLLKGLFAAKTTQTLHGCDSYIVTEYQEDSPQEAAPSVAPPRRCLQR